jgi:hypothetical protein
MTAVCCCKEFTVCPPDGWQRLTNEAGQGWLLPGNTDGPHRKDEKCPQLEAPQNQLSNTGIRGHLWYLVVLDHVNGRAQSVLCREHYRMDKKGKRTIRCR